jgi:hypothetical protein
MPSHQWILIPSIATALVLCVPKVSKASDSNASQTLGVGETDRTLLVSGNTSLLYGTAPSIGGSIGYRLMPKLELDAGASLGRYSIGIVKVDQTTYSAGAKYRMGRSFLVGTDVHYQWTKTSSPFVEKMFRALGSLPGSSETKVSTAGIGLYVGNHWQISRIVIGCDWLGITQDLALFSAHYAEPAYTDEQKAERRDFERDQKFDRGYIISRVNVGFLF